jgi:hypothetical protein
MPTVTFILGLCGAGKSWLAHRIIAKAMFDEGFLLVEIAFCQAEARQAILQELDAIPNLHVRWLCIENDLERANKNSRERTHPGDPDIQVQINRGLSPNYTYPEGAIVLRMWTRGT